MSSPSTSANAKSVARSKLISVRKVHVRQILFCFLTCVSACSGSSPEKSRDSKIYEAWDVINQPSRFGRDFETRFDNLSKAQNSMVGFLLGFTTCRNCIPLVVSFVPAFRLSGSCPTDSDRIFGGTTFEAVSGREAGYFHGPF
ncbi:MAG: hypothetical protein EBR09_07435 [Proteobacteria bacterium]|nr:hypothetical protein [Pseudomonadota bacterium]